jgi:hypothetical protein
MRYFTPELIARLNCSDPAEADAADAEWDRRQEEYEAELAHIEPTLPEHLRAFNELLLHDAGVLSLARQGEQLILVLHKDIPPRDLVIITYTLAGEPDFDMEALPVGMRSPMMNFDYDEFGVEKGVYTQSMLFSNGWEVRLRFRDVRFVVAEPLFASNRGSERIGAA